MSLDKADKDILGMAAKVVVTKDSTTIVGDGTTQAEVNKRVAQIKNQIEVSILEDFKFCVPLLVEMLRFVPKHSFFRLLIKNMRKKSSTRGLLNFPAVLLLYR